MRRLLTSDLQWADNDRDEYRHKFVDRLVKLARKVKPDAIYLLGDLTEEKDAHSARLVNRVVDHMYRLSEVAPVLVLRGNHDYRDIAYPFFEFIGRLERITWVNTPTAFAGALFLPHTRDYKRDWDGVDIKAHKLVFAHNIFEGTVTGTGHALSGIPTTIFGKGAKVYSGDVHEPIKVGPVTYVGAPYLCDFGDDYRPRVIVLDDERMTSIEVGGPQKRLVILVADQELKSSHANEGDILKVRVHCEPKDIAHWEKIKTDIRERAERFGFIVDTIQLDAAARVERGERPVHVQRTDVEVVDAYGKRLDLDETTMRIGRKIVEG